MLFLVLIAVEAVADWHAESCALKLSADDNAGPLTECPANKQSLLKSMSPTDRPGVDLEQIHIVFKDKGDIVSAGLGEMSNIYPHGALGDELEPTRLMVTGRSGRQHSVSLTDGRVFEDNRVRAVDIEGNGRSELLVVRAGPGQGAQLVLYGLDRDQLKEVAASMPIGTGFRWMNPVGSGDVDGDGIVELVSVRTPHIGGILELYRRRGPELILEHRLPGVSNHRYGSPEQRLSVLADMDQDGRAEVIVPAVGMETLLHIDWTPAGWQIRHRIDLEEPLQGVLTVSDIDADGRPELLQISRSRLRVWRYRSGHH